MNKVKIAAVSYINTFPFIYGIEKSGYLNELYEMQIEIPSKCAEYLMEDKVDVGLVPVAALIDLPYSEIVANYCIGAINEVKSVVLLSNSDINNITQIYLDYQSRTSVLLVQILAKFYWKVNIIWKSTSEGYEDKKLNSDEGLLIIGDRAFDQIDNYKFKYDLAHEWKNFTGLPFVFAAWISNKPLGHKFKELFNKSLQFGINHIPEAIKTYNSKDYNIDLVDYLNTNIDYILDDNKTKGMNKFLEYIKLLEK